MKVFIPCINRNLAKMLKFIYMLWSPISPHFLCPPPPISLLPLFLPSPMPYNAPSSSLITLSLSQLLSPLIYHCQYDLLTLHKTKRTLLPPSLASNTTTCLIVWTFISTMQCWPLIPTLTLSTSLIYQLSLHVGVSSPWNREILILYGGIHIWLL